MNSEAPPSYNDTPHGLRVTLDEGDCKLTADNEVDVSSVERSRRTYRRRKTLKSVGISLFSTLSFAGIVAFFIVRSPGWEVTRETFFSADQFSVSLPVVAKGLLINIKVLVMSVVTVCVGAIVLATLRSLRGPVFFPLRFLSAAWTDLFRGVPFIIVIYLVGFGIPALKIFDPVPSRTLLGVIALTLSYSSYVAEVLRAGMDSVHPSQRQAARSLGLSHGKTMRFVIIPQAVRKVTPALMNDFISMQKDVGLISILGATDAIRAAQIQQATSFNYTSFVVAGLLFVLMSLPFIRLSDWYTDRLRAREQTGGMV